MPKATFLNLDHAKRKHVTDAFLREFAVKSFDDASLSVVVKQLGIAKGSVYQYFEDKLDLFMYLVHECTAVKLSYTEAIKRENYSDYWAYFRDLFEQGFLFDKEHPLESHFLHNLTQNLRSPSVRAIYDGLVTQILEGFRAMAQFEVDQGLFRSDVPVETMGYLLYKIGVAIQEQLQDLGTIKPQESIANRLPVYQGHHEDLMQTVDDYIALSKSAFDKPTNL